MPICLVRAGFSPFRYAAATARRQSANVPTVSGLSRRCRSTQPGVSIAFAANWTMLAVVSPATRSAGRLVDAGRDPLERAREPVAVGLVLQDRGREVEDEDDVGAVGGGGAGGRDETAARQQRGDEDGDDDAGRWTDAVHVGPCSAAHWSGGPVRRQSTARQSMRRSHAALSRLVVLTNIPQHVHLTV